MSDLLEKQKILKCAFILLFIFLHTTDKFHICYPLDSYQPTIAMQFATLSSSFCPFQPCQLTKREDLFLLHRVQLEEKTPKFQLLISDSVPKGGAQTQFQTPNQFPKKALKGAIQGITVPTVQCTCHPIFMFNLLVPEALADIIDEKCTMGEQSLNNCRRYEDFFS